MYLTFFPMVTDLMFLFFLNEINFDSKKIMEDIDSLETDSSGTKIDVSINFIKDTAGYEEY